MAIMVGTGRGAQAGVLIRNAEALEQLARVDTLVVDKTGTLTEGTPAVTAVEAVDPASARDTNCSGWPPLSNAAARTRSPRRS